MIKAAFIFFGLATLVALPAAAQDATAMAINQAVLDQANTIVLRQKLAEAHRAAQAGQIAAAAKLYQESCDLVQQIGSGVDAESAEAANGLAATELTLARADQGRGDVRQADARVRQVLRVDPNNTSALAFKKQNDQMLSAMQGRIPSAAVVAEMPQIANEKMQAKTLVQDGKLLYEAGKLQEAEGKLREALALDKDNAAASYYLNIIQQDKYARTSTEHTLDTQMRITDVEKHWILPTSKLALTDGNPYATNTQIWTGPGRQAIVSKLDRIHLDSVSFDGLPLSEVLRNLSEQAKLRDPEHKGINFLINSNPDQSGQAVAATAGGREGFGAPGAAPAIDPATGLPAANAGGGAVPGEAVDVGAFTVKIPSLSDVRMADVLDAIVLVSDHPIKYTVQDFAVVFSAKGAETPAMSIRVFKVDPNTFYSGLESVSSSSFGSVNNSGSGGSGSSGSSGSSGGSSGGNSQNGGAVVGVVNAFAGAGGLRSSGSQGGGGGGGGAGQGAGSVVGAGGGGSSQSAGGLNFITTQTLAGGLNGSTIIKGPSALARDFFTSLGVNLEQPPGKAVFFNDRLGKLFVKATEQDLDTIERAIEMLNEVAPQVHIKARFIEVEQDDNKALGFDWYLGQFNVSGNGSVVGSGGSSPSLSTGQAAGTSAANPLGFFPGNTAASLIPGSATDQILTGGLRNSGPAVATITGILTNPNFRMVIHALEQRSGFESLAEPEITTISGRQTQMRATQIINVITSVNFQQGAPATTGVAGVTQ